MKLLVFLLLLGLVGAVPAYSQRAGWKKTPSSASSTRIWKFYEISDVYKGLVYVDTEVWDYKGNHILPLDGRWIVDCKNKRMIGENVTWVFSSGYWKSLRTDKPAPSSVARDFDHYCTYQ